MNPTQLAAKIREAGLGFIAAISFMGFMFGFRENKPIIILGSVLVFSLTQVTMQEIKNREQAKVCDMESTDLCNHYYSKQACTYAMSHGIQVCPRGKVIKEEGQDIV